MNITQRSSWAGCVSYATTIAITITTTTTTKTLAVSDSMCDHSMCEHSMCEHSMCEHEEHQTLHSHTSPHHTSFTSRHIKHHTFSTLYALYVTILCVNTLCVSTLCVSTKNIRHYTVTPHHITHPSHLTISHITRRNKENTKKKFLGRVLGPERRNLTTSHITHPCISPDIRHHISPHHTLQAERREHREVYEK